MFMIGNVSPEKQKLVQVAKDCLEIGIKAAKPFGFVGDIGNAIQKHAEKNGFSVVRDLCGHGVVWNSMRNRKFVISDEKELGCF